VLAALETCNLAGGCTLEFEPTIYKDVSIVNGVDETNWFCVKAENTQMKCLPYAFPNGLFLKGQPGTELHSPVYIDGYKRATPTLSFIHPIGPIKISNIVFDGQKAKQTSPTDLWNAQFHEGFTVWNMFYPEWYTQEHWSKGGCVENSVFRNYMQRGLSISMTENWEIKNNHVHDIGCKDDLTPCPLLTVSGTPDPKYQTPGQGIGLHTHTVGAQVHDNRVERVTKYGIDIKAGSSGEVAGIRDSHIDYNIIRNTGHIGIFASGISGTTFIGNIINSTNNLPEPIEQANYFNSFGMSIMANNNNNIFEGNYIINSAGMGFYFSEGAENGRNVFRNNIIEGSCREKHPDYCVDPIALQPWKRGCYNYPDVEFRNIKGYVLWEGNKIRDSNCKQPLIVTGSTPEASFEIRTSSFQSKRSRELIVQGIKLSLDRAFPDIPTSAEECSSVDIDKDGVVGIIDFSRLRDRLTQYYGKTCN
jgi:hypothetical protein